MHFLWWVPTTLVVYAFYAWLSKQSQEVGGVYFWILALAPAPLWAIITRLSKNILIDGLMFDISMLLGFLLGCIGLGIASGFNTHQYIGLILTVVGLVLMKIQ